MSTRWRVGDATITPVLECVWVLEGDNWLIPQASPDALRAHEAWLRPHYVTERFEMILFIQALVIESCGARILVDTCVGNHKPRRLARFDHLETPWLERLSDAGFAPDSIDTVLCTHLHFDHVGWNTMLRDGRWVPTFPNARYLIAEREWAHAQARSQGRSFAHLDDSVRPVFDAGLVDLIDPTHAITDEVHTTPTPGHTPGHVSVEVTSRGERALISGDMLHHPAQCAHPDWVCRADDDPPLAAETRRAALEQLADQTALLIGTHFAAPSAGHVVRDGPTWRFVPKHDA